MRWLVATMMLIVSLAGCAEDSGTTSAAKDSWDTPADCVDQPCKTYDNVNTTAPRPTPGNETQFIIVEAAPHPQTSWWMPCDWQSFAPGPSEGTWAERRPLNIAHQGGENEVPSATMYALKTSLRKGADMLEIDVHVTADGEIVVLHDTSVDRTTNGEGIVQEMNLADIKALDAAYWFVPGEPANHSAPDDAYILRGVRDGLMPPPPGCTPEDFTIPTLREVLEEFPNILMNIEIKNGPPQGTGFEENLANLLAEFERGNDTIVVAFQDQWTETFRIYNDEVHTAPGTVEAAIFKASSIGPGPGTPSHHSVLQVPVEYEGVEVIDQDGDFIRDAHSNGWAVHVWTINDPEEMHWLLDIGADGIMTAEPTTLASVLAERAA